MNAKRGIIVLGLLSTASMPTWAQQIKGVVIDGNFQIDGLDKEKTYTLYINYVGYKTQKIDGVQAKDADQVIALQPDEQQLKEVTVTAVERRNTDAAMIQVATGHGDRYIGSLFRVDEPVPDDSSIISPRCFNRLSWSEKSIACLVYCILPLFDVTYTL